MTQVALFIQDKCRFEILFQMAYFIQFCYSYVLSFFYGQDTVRSRVFVPPWLSSTLCPPPLLTYLLTLALIYAMRWRALAFACIISRSNSNRAMELSPGTHNDDLMSITWLQPSPWEWDGQKITTTEENRQNPRFWISLHLNMGPPASNFRELNFLTLSLRLRLYLFYTSYPFAWYLGGNRRRFSTKDNFTFEPFGTYNKINTQYTVANNAQKTK